MGQKELPALVMFKSFIVDTGADVKMNRSWYGFVPNDFALWTGTDQ